MVGSLYLTALGSSYTIHTHALSMYVPSHVFIISFYDNFISVIRYYINFTIKKIANSFFLRRRRRWNGIKPIVYSILCHSYLFISTFSNFSFLISFSSHFPSVLTLFSAKTNWQFYDIKFISVAAFTIPLYDDNLDEGHSGGFAGVGGGWGSWTKLLILFVFLPEQ